MEAFNLACNCASSCYRCDGGGAWNASIAAEVLSWQGHVVRATGLGAYIADAHAHGLVNAHVWAILVMCLYVIVINRIFWYPLYRYTEKHYAQI